MDNQHASHSVSKASKISHQSGLRPFVQHTLRFGAPFADRAFSFFLDECFFLEECFFFDLSATTTTGHDRVYSFTLTTFPGQAIHPSILSTSPNNLTSPHDGLHSHTRTQVCTHAHWQQKRTLLLAAG